MYIARLGEGFIVKRMPDSGSQHAPGCPAFEPPSELSGLHEARKHAIHEDPSTGTTTLKLSFSLSRRQARAAAMPRSSIQVSPGTAPKRLSLRGLLHYVWDQAELTRWHPGFTGRRNWATVRHHLLQAAAGMRACGDKLGARLYVPEIFSVQEQEAICARRREIWARSSYRRDAPQQLSLLIAEVKELAPARHGYRALIKHVPDIGFSMEERLYSQLDAAFGAELSLWGSSEDIRLVMIAAFGLSEAGVPEITRLCLMPVTREWLPVETSLDQQLLARLVREQRAFTKILRYDLGAQTRIASVVLTDCGEPAPWVFSDDAP
jgi:hypothetical protein